MCNLSLITVIMVKSFLAAPPDDVAENTEKDATENESSDPNTGKCTFLLCAYTVPKPGYA